MAAAGEWYDHVTRLMVTIALPPVGNPLDLHRVNELANVAEVPFLALWPQFGIVVAHFRNRLNPEPFAGAVYGGIAALPHYTAPPAHSAERMRIIMDQGRIALSGAAALPRFLDGILATGLAAAAFSGFLDLGVLAPHGAALLPPAGPFTVARIRLALAWFRRDRNNADVRAFLTAQVLHPPNAPAVFQAAVQAEIAGAGRTERDILDDLGFAPVAVAPPIGGAAGLPLGNLALPGSAMNTLLVTGRPYLAQVVAANAAVHTGPAVARPTFRTLSTGTSVHVMGSTGGWYAVDVAGRLGFIQVADLSPPPP
jgi:hypothetical protein